DARHALTRLYTALKNVVPAEEVEIDWKEPHAARLRAAMNDDFNTAEAVAVLFDLAGEVNRTQDVKVAGLLKALGRVLGLLERDPVVFLQGGMDEDGLSPDVIEAKIAERAGAKKAKDFAVADRIRN